MEVSSSDDRTWIRYELDAVLAHVVLLVGLLEAGRDTPELVGGRDLQPLKLILGAAVERLHAGLTYKNNCLFAYMIL